MIVFQSGQRMLEDKVVGQVKHHAFDLAAMAVIHAEILRVKTKNSRRYPNNLWIKPISYKSC